jgi:hypothetical protein
MFDRRIILLEFNELCPSLIHRFIGLGQLPTFQRLHSQSLVYTTRAQERSPFLDPWIQWATVHTGLNYEDHQISKLNEGHLCGARRIWDLVSEEGGTVWICGSMSTAYRHGFNGALIPDPWTTKVEPMPIHFRPYFEFVRKSVLDSTNERAPRSQRDLADFVRFMVTHGLSARTVAAVVKQILAEVRGHHRWKRATILDLLQFDVFCHYWKRQRPAFSTLFLNSTAHFQHLHWREMEPELFQVQPTAAEAAAFRSAILFGYEKMDDLLARVLEMADKQTTVVLATALSQQPCLGYEHQGGKAFYRPLDFEGLLAFAGVSGYTGVAPVMAHQFHIELESEDAARDGQERLTALRVDGHPAMSVERKGRQIFAWCPITTDLGPTAVLQSEAGGRHLSRDFHSIFYKVEGLKSGMHHPDGLLWIRRPTTEHHIFEQPVDLALVAPTLLAELGIAPEASMRQAVVPGF